MSASAPEPERGPGPPQEPAASQRAPPGQGLAIAAQSLYLANLLILPGLAFVVLLILYFKQAKQAPPLAACHLRQTLAASVWAGIMLVVCNALIIVLGGYGAPATWVIVILYFTIVHATLVLLGSVGLARAMAGKHYHFPWVGARCPA